MNMSIGKNNDINIFHIWSISALYGIMAIFIDLIILIKSDSIGSFAVILSAFRSGGWILLIVGMVSTIVLILLKIVELAKPNFLAVPLQQAILMTPWVFILVFFLMFDRFYNKSDVLLTTEVIGGIVALIITWVSYLILKSGDKAERLRSLSPIFSVIGTIVIAIAFVLSFKGKEDIMAGRGLDDGKRLQGGTLQYIDRFNPVNIYG